MNEIRNSGAPPRVSGAEYIRDNSQKKLIITEEDKKEKKDGSPDPRQRHPHGQITDDVEVHHKSAAPEYEEGQQLSGQIIPDPTHQISIFAADTHIFIVGDLAYDDMVRFADLTITQVAPEIKADITSVDGQALDSPLKVTLIKPENPKKKETTTAPAAKASEAPPQAPSLTISYANQIPQSAREHDDQHDEQDALILGAMGVAPTQKKPKDKQPALSPQLKVPQPSTAPRPLNPLLSEEQETSIKPSAESLMLSKYHDDCESIKTARMLFEECDPMHSRFFETIAPGPAHNFPDSLAILFAAIIADNATVWIGPKSLATIEEKYHGMSATTLADQFQKTKRILLDNVREQWTQSELTLDKNQKLNPIKILKKRENDTTLIIVRLALSVFGLMQLEFSRTRETISATIRGKVPLPMDMQKEIEELLTLLAKRSNITGNLSFGLIDDSQYGWEETLKTIGEAKPNSVVT